MDAAAAMLEKLRLEGMRATGEKKVAVQLLTQALGPLGTLAEDAESTDEAVLLRQLHDAIRAYLMDWNAPEAVSLFEPRHGA